MASNFLKRLTLAAVVVGGLGLLAAPPAEATRPVRRTTRPEAARGFNLFAGAVNVVMNVNRVQCNINNIGETCVDPTNSSVVGGGFWPKGTPDQYIFNSGLQVAGILGGTRASFPWAGDTVGAFFMDPRGDQSMGQGLTNVMNALNAEDMAVWPTAAYIQDTSLFNSALIGRQTVSQQDTWVRYWDGNPSLAPSARKHPMGLLVDQRGLMWNFPSGNQDIVYFLYRFINITATDPSKYANLTHIGFSAQDVADVVSIAQNFQSTNEAAFNVALPDSGWDFQNVYAAFAQDPDVGQSGTNYSTAVLPFAMGIAYQSNFFMSTWSYPADIFSAPFAAAVGFEGVKYLKSPTVPNSSPRREYGITMFTNTTNGAPFPDRVGVAALWRLMSGNLLAQDGTCTQDFRPVPTGQGMCYLASTAVDTRFVQASGPFTLKAGESAVIVVAYVHAAPIAAYITPSTSFDLKPGVPGTIYRLAAGQDTIRTIERVAGIAASVPALVSSKDVNGNGVIDQTELATVPRSLLNKSLVAQAVFNAKFLLPFAPESPSFFLIPGDGQVTVVWQRSTSETNGDPYFSVASDPLNALYDPNFRRYDVEGYRIWRGRSQSEMELVASFDYTGTTITDKNGAFWSSDVYGNRCAPELGIRTTCPVAFAADGSGPTHAVDLVGDIIQVPPGGRAQLASGDIIIVSADTAIIGGNTGLPGLTDNGVPFVYVDNAVRNGFRYYYAVTAFDINSYASGPSSLESPLVSHEVTPRAVSSQTANGSLGELEMMGDGNVTLNTSAAVPTIDRTTGIFSGPMPPTNGIEVGFLAFVPEVVQSGTVELTIDSVVPGSTLTNVRATQYWFTNGTTKFSIPITSGGDYPEILTTSQRGFLTLPFVQSLASRYGGDTTYSLNASATVKVPGAWGLTMQGRAYANSHPSSPHSAPRWWAGADNENTNDPNGQDCDTQTGSYTCTLSDLTRNAGKITGVDIWGIRSYMTVATSSPTRDMEGITSTVFRAADFKWYWGANGAVDSVVDVTHHVRVPFNTGVRASWGILNDSSFVATTASGTYDGKNTLLTWSDVFSVAPISAYLGLGASTAVLMNHARLSPVAYTGGSTAATASMVTNGNGFIIYLNGHWFMMRMTALPAAGTVWNARFFSGNVTGRVGGYAYAPQVRPPAVPGLKLRIEYNGSTFDPAVTTDALLEAVHTVPDPYYVTNQLEITASTKLLRFVNLPAQAIIRVYSSSGVLVNLLTHNDVTGGGEQVWNLRNRNNQFVASGVYFYHVETPDGRTKVGRFTVVNYAQ